MTLSTEQRALLLQNANRLREEVSVLTSERDAAYVENAQALEDAKLIAEVVRLERERDDAERLRDAAVNSTEDALAVMQKAIDEQVAASQNVPPPAVETPVMTNEERVGLSDKPVETDKPAESASINDKGTKGGNR